jgi:hypothetical protein
MLYVVSLVFLAPQLLKILNAGPTLCDMVTDFGVDRRPCLRDLSQPGRRRTPDAIRIGMVASGSALKGRNQFPFKMSFVTSPPCWFPFVHRFVPAHTCPNYVYR